MSKRPDYGDATPEDLTRALMRRQASDVGRAGAARQAVVGGEGPGGQRSNNSVSEVDNSE